MIRILDSSINQIMGNDTIIHRAIKVVENLPHLRIFSNPYTIVTIIANSPNEFSFMFLMATGVFILEIDINQEDMISKGYDTSPMVGYSFEGFKELYPHYWEIIKENFPELLYI